ncbi:fungal hydrophobin [Schizopora paradoxa]|uniref:Hydrophobin n=1 Tax=Schizopora paradoxa TaxID=27342 RepID=A0A0H2RYK1_9AGAM|nr:fungal hydrophobin [Schizopora paradoxa]
MFFNKFAALALVPLFAVATPTPPAVNQCNTGSVQCCNSVQDANSPSIANLLGPLGVVVSGITGQVGVTCNPITIIGVSGTSCTSQPVCCENNSFNGLVALGCTPININL